MEATHDTEITIVLPGIGNTGSIVAKRGDLAQVLTFDSTLRSAIEEAIDCALVALEEVQLNPPPAFPEPVVEVKTPAPKGDKPKKTPAKKEPKPKAEKKQAKPKLDAAPTTAPAPRVEEPKPAPVTEKPTEPAKPEIQQLTLF